MLSCPPCDQEHIHVKEVRWQRPEIERCFIFFAEHEAAPAGPGCHVEVEAGIPTATHGSWKSIRSQARLHQPPMQGCVPEQKSRVGR